MFMTVKNIFTLRAVNRWAFDAIKLLLKIGFLFTGDVDKAAIHLLCKIWTIYSEAEANFLSGQFWFYVFSLSRCYEIFHYFLRIK